MKKIKFIPLIFWIFVSQMAGLIGSIFTITGIDSWYAMLNKPFFNPPNWVFGPVWTILYTLMGISAYLVWKEKFNKKQVRSALLLFGAHLIFNSLWSIIFFGLKMPELAFMEIVALWLMIVMMIKEFKIFSKWASWLLWPYLAWVSFAAILNGSIALLN